jgi:hypothetical protein
MSLTVEMHTTDDDFAKTKEYLEMLLAHGTWKVPNLKSTFSRGLVRYTPKCTDKSDIYRVQTNRLKDSFLCNYTSTIIASLQ